MVGFLFYLAVIYGDIEFLFICFNIYGIKRRIVIFAMKNTFIFKLDKFDKHLKQDLIWIFSNKNDKKYFNEELEHFN